MFARSEISVCHPERTRSARRVSRSFAQAREASGAKPQGVADAGSINDYGWLSIEKVTFSSVSQQKSLRDPFLARPLVVLVGLPRSAKPHLSKLRCGSASLTQDDAPTFTHRSIESGYVLKIYTAQTPRCGGADSAPAICRLWMTHRLFDLKNSFHAPLPHRHFLAKMPPPLTRGGTLQP